MFYVHSIAQSKSFVNINNRNYYYFYRIIKILVLFASIFLSQITYYKRQTANTGRFAAFCYHLKPPLPEKIKCPAVRPPGLLLQGIPVNFPYLSYFSAKTSSSAYFTIWAIFPTPAKREASVKSSSADIHRRSFSSPWISTSRFSTPA